MEHIHIVLFFYLLQNILLIIGISFYSCIKPIFISLMSKMSGYILIKKNTLSMIYCYYLCKYKKEYK